jgi:4-amino-4-deoxy-L-arabinose transferase-like glycosyltransferase
MDGNKQELVNSKPWFAPGLCGLTVLGVIVRISYAVLWENGTKLVGDPEFFQLSASNLAHGYGYAVPFLGKGKPVATALHPPLFSGLLAAFDLVGVQSADAHRIALAFVSAGSIVLMGMIGKRLMGASVGLIAATFAALSPLWVQWGGRLLSESLYLIVIPLLLLVALQCADLQRWWLFGLTGVAIGIATLTRAEAVGYILILGIPLIFLTSKTWRTRVRYGAAILTGVIVILGPWIVRNDVQLGGLTISTDSGTTWVGSYTKNTFSPSNSLYGSFDNETQFADTAVFIKEGKPPNGAKTWTELPLSDVLSRVGITYARDHLTDLPGVVLAREGREWGVYALGSQLQYDSEEGGQVPGFFVAGEILELISLPLAVAGAFILAKRSRRDLVIILAPVVLTLIDAALFYGTTRLRAGAEPSIFLLSSITLVSSFHWLRKQLTPAPHGP